MNDDSAKPVDVVRPHWWVNLRYRLYDSTGQALEESPETARYLHGGYGVMFPKLEEALDGKAVGETVWVRLEPADHFGEYDPDLVFLHKLKDFEQPIEEGEVLEGRPGLPDDGRNYRVLHVAADSVVLDGNHPYSEIAPHYELVVESVKPATKEEIEIQKTAHEMDLYDDEDSLDASDVEEEQSSWDIPQAGDHRLH